MGQSRIELLTDEQRRALAKLHRSVASNSKVGRKERVSAKVRADELQPPKPAKPLNSVLNRKGVKTGKTLK